MKEIVSNVKKEDGETLQEILDKNFYFDDSGKGDFKSTGDIQKSINGGEEKAVDKFNKKIKEILKLSLKKFVESSCSNNEVYKFFEKISNQGLKKDNINNYKDGIKLLKSYMNKREQGK